MSIIAVIPARGGSRRIPGKNIRSFHGRPIIEYSIMAAKVAGLFSRIYVSTDSPAIASVAQRSGADVIPRPRHLAVDSVGTQEVVRHAITWAKNAMSQSTPPVYVCCIYATAPLMYPLDLIEGYAELIRSGGPYVYSVGPDWEDAGQWYWGTADAFLGEVPLDHGDLHQLPAERTCDINTDADWTRAETLYDNMLKEQS